MTVQLHIHAVKGVTPLGREVPLHSAAKLCSCTVQVVIAARTAAAVSPPLVQAARVLQRLRGALHARQAAVRIHVGHHAPCGAD